MVLGKNMSFYPHPLIPNPCPYMGGALGARKLATRRRLVRSRGVGRDIINQTFLAVFCPVPSLLKSSSQALGGLKAELPWPMQGSSEAFRSPPMGWISLKIRRSSSYGLFCKVIRLRESVSRQTFFCALPSDQDEK